MGSQPGIVLYRDNYNSVRNVLSQEQKGNLIDALMDGDEYRGSDPLVEMAFNVFSAAIRVTEERYERRCQRNAENIRKRWEKEKVKTDMTEYDRIPENTIGYERPENKNKNKKQNQNKRFIPPTVEEVTAYCQERGNNIDPERFVDYYAARGWEIKPGQKMKDWKATIRTWEKNGRRWTDESRGIDKGDRVRGQRDLYCL